MNCSVESRSHNRERRDERGAGDGAIALSASSGVGGLRRLRIRACRLGGMASARGLRDERRVVVVHLPFFCWWPASRTKLAIWPFCVAEAPGSGSRWAGSASARRRSWSRHGVFERMAAGIIAQHAASMERWGIRQVTLVTSSTSVLDEGTASWQVAFALKRNTTPGRNWKRGG